MPSSTRSTFPGTIVANVTPLQASDNNHLPGGGCAYNKRVSNYAVGTNFGAAIVSVAPTLLPNRFYLYSLTVPLITNGTNVGHIKVQIQQDGSALKTLYGRLGASGALISLSGMGIIGSGAGGSSTFAVYALVEDGATSATINCTDHTSTGDPGELELLIAEWAPTF